MKTKSKEVQTALEILKESCFDCINAAVNRIENPVLSSDLSDAEKINIFRETKGLLDEISELDENIFWSKINLENALQKDKETKKPAKKVKGA